MWMAAVTYSNNLVYAVLYLIAGLTFVSLFHTWRNLASLEVDHVRVKPSFAGEEIEMEIHLRNRGRRPSSNLSFQRLERHGSMSLRSHKGTRIDPGDSVAVTAFLPPQRRGRYEFRRLAVRSAYPFGLFWATLRVPVESVHYVYPAPRGRDDLPASQTSSAEGSPVRAGDDFSGVRAYSPGESLRHIDWKAYARGRPLVVKQFTGGEGRELWLEPRSLPRMTFEEKLSQLTLWAIEAEEGDLPYGLSLGDVRVAPSTGTAHQRIVLEALATASAAL
jgi:uncharacterized protein (DUF58 family)